MSPPFHFLDKFYFFDNHHWFDNIFKPFFLLEFSPWSNVSKVTNHRIALCSLNLLVIVIVIVITFLPDPGVPGVRSMGPGVSIFGWNFADVTLADDKTNSILLMMPIYSNPWQFVINAIYASCASIAVTTTAKRHCKKISFPVRAI